MRSRNNNYMVSNYANQLGEFIQDEFHDNRYYTELAEKAPNAESKRILLQIADDENTHAKNFMREYYRLTGKSYQVKPIELEDIPSFREALLVRIKAEINGYKTYQKQSLIAPNRILGDLFAEAAAGETEHAMLLQMLYSEGAM